MWLDRNYPTHNTNHDSVRKVLNGLFLTRQPKENLLPYSFLAPLSCFILLLWKLWNQEIPDSLKFWILLGTSSWKSHFWPNLVLQTFRDCRRNERMIKFTKFQTCLSGKWISVKVSNFWLLIWFTCLLCMGYWFCRFLPNPKEKNCFYRIKLPWK